VGNRCADHVTPLYPQKLALTSPTGGGRSVGIVRSRTEATEFSLYRLEWSDDTGKMSRQECGRKRWWANLKWYPGIFQEELRVITKISFKMPKLNPEFGARDLCFTKQACCPLNPRVRFVCGTQMIRNDKWELGKGRKFLFRSIVPTELKLVENKGGEIETLLNFHCVITKHGITAYGKPALMIFFVLR
jgi:hypothetical protein